MSTATTDSFGNPAWPASELRKVANAGSGMTVTTAEYNPATMTPHRRANVRAELAQMHERLPADGLSATISVQVLETAINGLDAVDRVAALADSLAETTGPAGLIGRMIATEIRNSLRGI